VPSGSVATEALSIGELKRMAIFHIAMKDATGKQIAVTGKAFFDVDHAAPLRACPRRSTWPITGRRGRSWAREKRLNQRSDF